MSKPTKTQIVLSAFIILLVAGVVGASAYIYQTNRKPAATESVAQLTRERNDAVKALQIHDGVNKVNLDEANKQTALTESKLTAVCTSLKTTKVTNAYCQ